MTRTLSCPSLLLIFLTVGSPVRCAENLDLVRDSQPLAKIVMSRKPTRLESFAAEELRTYIQKATGADLPIVADTAVGEHETLICIGRNRFSAGLADSLAAAPVDSIRLKRDGKRLLLLGRDSPDVDPRKTGSRTLASQRGTLNSVYEFLERQLGVRWYWPGEMGEVVPTSDNLAVGDLNIEFAPHFIYRHSHQSQEVMDDQITADEFHRWWLRQRLGGVEGNATANHSFNNSPVRFGKQHPEWFALQANGQRLNAAGPWGGHVCFSNEELFQQTVRDVLDYFEQNPTNRFHAVMPGDGLANHFCQCPGCQSQVEPDRGPTGRYSKYVWSFVNRVAREVGQRYPDRVITCCAYGGYKTVPEGIDFEPNVSVTLCRNFGGSGGNYECYRNPLVMQESQDLLAQWSAAVDNVYIWDYHNLRWNRMMKGVPVVSPHGIAAELRYDRQAGVKGHIVEYNTISSYERQAKNLPHNWENWLMDTINIYATFRLLWHVETDVDAMLDEYCHLFFGPAEQPMRAFYLLLESRWMETPLPEKAVVAESPANVWLHIYPPPVVEQLFAYLADARQLADNSICGRRIAWLQGDFQIMREKSRQWALAAASGNENELNGDCIANGSFEQVTNAGLLEGPWGMMNARIKEARRVFSVSTERANSGQRSFRINAAAYGENVATMNYVIASTNDEYRNFSGRQLKLTYYVFHESGELTLTTHVRLFQEEPGQKREYCNSIISVRSVPVVTGQWTKVEKIGVVPFYEHIVTMDILIGVRHSGSDPPVVYFDDFSLTPMSGDGGY
jgi:hypothetical protein